MAKYQYRVNTEGNWHSSFGAALLAITNTSGSNKKITIRSLEYQSMAMANTGTLSSMYIEMAKCTTVEGGDNLEFARSSLDSTAVLPAGVTASRGGYAVGTVLPLGRHTLVRNFSGLGSLNGMASYRPYGPFHQSQVTSVNTAVEPVTVRPGESFAIYPTTARTPGTYRVNVVIRVDGKNHTYNFMCIGRHGVCLFGLQNASASTVQIVRVGFTDSGIGDTPYYRIVRFTSVHPLYIDSPANQIATAVPVDSTYPALTADVCRIYGDVPLIPEGVPEVMMADGSAGSPKGLNYLHTKDYNGPSFRVLFPENARLIASGGGLADDLGHALYGFKNCNLLYRAPIVLQPGEGVAIVSSIESAITGSPGFSGSQSTMFAATLDVEPLFTPTLTLTGLAAGSEVRVLDHDTQEELAGAEEVNTGSFSYEYEFTGQSVDIVLHAIAYEYLRLNNVPLTATNLTVPIQQRTDRNFANP